MGLLRDLWQGPSVEEWRSLAFVLAGLLAFIGAAEFVRKVFHWSPEFTRKLVHVSVGVLIFFAPQIFVVPLPALILSILFIIVNFLSVRFDLLKGMHATERRTYGTVYYPFAFLILVVLFWYRSPVILSLSILVLALADASAAIVGEGMKAPAYYHLSSDRKTFQGSLAMFLVSFAVLFGGVLQYLEGSSEHYDFVFAVAGTGALMATAWEALSSRGLDNLTIPLSVAFVLSYYLLPGEHVDVAQFTLGSAFAILAAAVSYYARMLDLSGAVATYILAAMVFGIGGWQWSIPILMFFVLSSLLSKTGKSQKARFENMFEKSTTRDYAQVFANGGIAGILLVLGYCFPSWDFYPLFLGSLAAVTADTWGTELGLLSRGKTFLITNFKPVEGGSNGGVSMLGLGAGLGGGAVIALSGYPWYSDGVMVIKITMSGLLASVVDSFLGATVQAEYRCDACGRITERKLHCDNQATVLVRGIRWIDNDAVNWACAFTGAALLLFSTVL